MIVPEDRGFALGDGLFETLLVLDGRPLNVEAHLARLSAGCVSLGLPAPDHHEAHRAVVEAAAGMDRAAVRISYSAGPGGRGLDRPEAPSPRLVAVAGPAPTPGAPMRLARVRVRRNEGSPASKLKSLSYLDSVLARREARDKGADEALMLNNRGELACAAAANLFWIDGTSLFTPALDCGVLAGTLRAALIARLPVREVRADPDALQGVDALFLTNALIGVAPVSEIDGYRLSPHPRIAELQALVADLVPPLAPA